MLNTNVWLETQLNRDYRHAREQEAAQERTLHPDSTETPSLWRRLNPLRS